MKATNRTSETLIRTLGGAGAVTQAAPLGFPSTSQGKPHTHARTRQHNSRLAEITTLSAETDTAITWKARKTPLQSAFLSLCESKYNVSVCECNHACAPPRWGLGPV